MSKASTVFISSPFVERAAMGWAAGRRQARPPNPAALLGLHRNGASLGFGSLRQGHGEEAILEAGRHLAAIHCRRQPHRAGEGAIGALHAVVLRLLLLLLMLLLALDRQHLILERHGAVLRLDAGDLGLD